MNRAVVALSLFVFCLNGRSPAESADYRFHKEVVRDQPAGEGILSVPLDADVYAATRTELPDLRLLDGAGTEVPYVLEQARQVRTRPSRDSCDSEVVSLRERDDHVLEIVVKLKKGAADATGLTVVSPLSDYEHRVRVFGSGEVGDWTLLLDSGLVFDYSRYMDVRNRDLVLPANHARRFKLEVSQGLEQRESPFLGLVKELKQGNEKRQLEFRELLRRPFRIDRVEAWRMVERPTAEEPDRRPYRAEVERVDRDPQRQLTVVQIRTRREPLTRFTVRTSSRNFSRPVRVEVPQQGETGGRFREIGRGAIHRFQLGDFRDERLDVEFPETRSESYRIVIEDGDSPPLEVTSVDAEGNLYQLTFVAADQAKYRLVYGSVDAAAPRYDAAAVLASLGPRQKAVPASLGQEVADRVAPRARAWPDLLNSRLALMVALALMVLVLAWALVRAGKAIDTLPKASG